MEFSTLYDEDTETWAELQVVALRRLACTPGPWANAIDWENVIEEVEDLGAERRRAVESLLENAFVHVLRLPRTLTPYPQIIGGTRFRNFGNKRATRPNLPCDHGSTCRKFGNVRASGHQKSLRRLTEPCLRCGVLSIFFRQRS